MHDGGTTSVGVHDLPVDALIGVEPDERNRKQRLLVTVEIALCAARATTLAETVDYRTVAAAAHRLGTGHLDLIEDYAARLAEQCLTFGAVASVRVIVQKPGALDGGLATTTVRMARAEARILPFARVPHGADGRTVRFRFRRGIGIEAQHMLASFLDQFIASIDGVDARRAVFDGESGDWIVGMTLGGERSARVERDAPGRRQDQDSKERGG